jgi:preprotein translocase subunit SecA
MDYLRQGIHLRGYAQKQPKQEYKRESFELFSELLDKVKRDVTQMLARVRIRSEEEVQQLEEQDRRRMEAQATRMQFQHADAGGYGADEEAAEAQAMAAMGMGVLAAGPGAPKVGRNDPCPCGSGKKFKQCHGQLA